MRRCAFALVVVFISGLLLGNCGKKTSTKGVEEYLTIIENYIKVIKNNRSDSKKLASELEKLVKETEKKMKTLKNDPGFKEFATLYEKSVKADIDAAEKLRKNYGKVLDKYSKLIVEMSKLNPNDYPALNDMKVVELNIKFSKLIQF